MPTMIAMASIRVMRDGRSIVVPPGKAFDFTISEVTAIREHNFSALRNPKNESVATNETQLLQGKTVPEDADDAVDANILSKTKAKAKGARNQGGALPAEPEEDEDL